MSVFVDTSAFYALLVGTEAEHSRTLNEFRVVIADLRTMWTTSYIIVETTALLQHRIGLAPVRDFDDKFRPLLSVEWVDAALHRKGMARLRSEDRRRLSLVDCVSFEFMRKKGLRQALTLDLHFAESGFDMLPET